MKLHTLMTLTGLAVCALSLQSVAWADSFTFENQTPGDFLQSPSVLASDGTTTGTFTVTGTPTAAKASEAFQFVNNAGSSGVGASNLSGITLQNVDADPNDLLTITFSKKVTSVSLDFAIVPFTGTTPANTLTLASALGFDTEAGTFTSASGDFEGTLTLSNALGFDSISIQRSGPAGDYYALDNLNVQAIPELGTWAGFAMGLGFTGNLVRRRRTQVRERV